MKDKIRFLKLNNYINRNLLDYLTSRKDNNITEVISHLKENFDKNEVIPTILNAIENDIDSKNLIFYLDLINYYISIVSENKIIFLRNMVSEKLQNLLSFVSKTENRSIIYQYIIDYSALYDINIQKLKKTFPIDREMFIKKVVELATSKTYLRFLLMYEVVIFFSKNELNSLWLEINSFTDKEKILFFKIFMASFNTKNQKKIFKFIAKQNKQTIKTFISTLRFFHSDKELYFKNILKITDEDFNTITPSQIKNGLFSQSKVMFSPKNQKLIFILDFFEYKKYTLIIEADFNLNYLNSKIVKQPMIFNRDFFSKSYKDDYTYQIKMDTIIAKELYRGIIFNIKKDDFPIKIMFINYFTFKNTLKLNKYNFTIKQNLRIKDFNINKNILELIIKNNLHQFIDLEYLIPKNISHKKKDMKLFISSPIFKLKFDKYIKENKTNILNSIKIFIELSKSLNNKKDIIAFFILLYLDIEKKHNNFIEIPQIEHLLLYHLNHTIEV